MTASSAKPPLCPLTLLACALLLVALPVVAQQVLTIDAMPTTVAAGSALDITNSSTSNASLAFSPLSPPSLLPSAVLERLHSLLSGYLSQGGIGLLAFAVVVLAMLLCMRQAASFIHSRDWPRSVSLLWRRKGDGRLSDTKSSPRPDGPQPSRHRVAHPTPHRTPLLPTSTLLC